MEDFVLEDIFVQNYEHVSPDWGFASGPNSIGEITFFRTYSRKKEDGSKERWHETVERVVNGIYSYQKRHCLDNNLSWSDSKAQRSAKIMFDKIFNFKFTPPGRGLWMAGTDYVDKRGGAALNNPLHIDTKILTKEYGWVELGSILNEDVTVLTSIHDYGSHADKLVTGSAASPTWADAKISESEWQPTLKIVFEDNYGNRQEVVSSKNHRWFRRKHKSDWNRVDATELSVGDYIPIVKPQSYYQLSTVGQQHGFFFGDGTRSNGELHQFGDSLPVLNKLFSDTCVVDDDYHEVVRHLPLAWSNIPSGNYRKDKKYLYGFLSGYFAADGSVDTNGSPSISSSRLEELEVVADLFREVGVRCTDPFVSIQEGAKNNLVEHRSALYSINITPVDLREDFFLKDIHRQRWLDNLGIRRRDWYKIVDIEEYGVQEVACAEVPGYEQFVIDGFILTSNCGFVSTENHEQPAEPFAWLMDMSMLGVGVGFDTDGVGLPVYQPVYMNGNSPAAFVIPDSREGWVDSLRVLLNSYFVPGSPEVKFDYSLIRPAGSLIKGFGGVSQGPEPLIKLHERIKVVLNEVTRLNSRAIVDIMNMIGACVVAGNVRRSAEIALGDANDSVFLDLKNYELFPERMDWSWASNNSVKASVGNVDYDDIATRIANNGEPGLVYMDVAREQARIGEYKPDPNAKGFNPCGEQVLDDMELCTLVEVFPSRHDSYEEFQETLKFAYLYAKSVTLVPTHNDATNKVMSRNRRIGTSLSGQVDFRYERGIETLKGWMLSGYNYLENLDDQYSTWLDINKSIRKTTVKPSGTTSLLAGVSPGAHYPTHDTYIRRVRFSENHELVEKLRNANYPVEQDLYSDSTVVVEMPVKGRGIPTEKEVSIWDKAAMATFASYYWADNSVSVTVTFDETEKNEIADVLRFNEGKWKSVSMLPLTKDGAYKQMPYEAITEEEYQRRAAVLKKIDLDEFYSNGNEAEGEIYCTTDKCTVAL